MSRVLSRCPRHNVSFRPDGTCPHCPRTARPLRREEEPEPTEPPPPARQFEPGDVGLPVETPHTFESIAPPGLLEESEPRPQASPPQPSPSLPPIPEVPERTRRRAAAVAGPGTTEASVRTPLGALVDEGPAPSPEMAIERTPPVGRSVPAPSFEPDLTHDERRAGRPSRRPSAPPLDVLRAPASPEARRPVPTNPPPAAASSSVAAPPPERRPRARSPLLVGTLAALAVIGAVVAFVRGAYPPLRAAVMEHFDPDAQWKLRTVNSAGRSGAFFLPDGYASGPLPMMVVLHGDGMTPVSLVARWRQRADMDHFIVIAPDSASPSADVAGWQVPELAGRSTEDLEHIGRCIEEVLAMKGVQADPRVLVVGVGSAASMALYLASIDPRYTAFALMHGSASVDVLGDRRVHGWLSDKPGGEVTAHGSVRETRTDLQGLGFPAQYREFFADDGAGREEMASLATWWLSEPPPQGAP